MYIYELSAMVVYFFLLLAVAFFSYRRNISASDFIIGNRSMNYWLTALAAHASDMSSWLFMGYPASVLGKGYLACWTAIGLIICMYLNWQFIAPRIRVATEQYNNMTFSSFFESRFADTSGLIRLFSALILITFYTIYISAGLTGLGDNLELLFDLHYVVGILCGIILIIPYVFTGGYMTLAWIDLFQGFFLLGVIIFVPIYILFQIGGMSTVSSAIMNQHLAESLIPDFSKATWISIISMTLGWGLGYFGQPHIVTKFMGIRRVSEIHKSKWIGMSWMVLSLSAATLVGVVGIAYFGGNIGNHELVFIEMVKKTFHPFLTGFILCAVLAATINAMSSQILVLSSSLTEDFYKRLIRPMATSKELLIVSRLGVVAVAVLAFLIAFRKTSTIYGLVEYAWTGIGASFGPLVILSLYSKRVNKYGAWAGILTGGIVAGTWPYFNKTISSMLPGFFLSIFAILLISLITRKKASQRV
jgi:sodium/proline symporter